MGAQFVPRATEAVNISSTDYTFTLPIQGIWIGGAGNVVCRYAGDATDRTIPVVAGSFLPGAISVVRKVNTTATGMFGMTDYIQATGA